MSAQAARRGGKRHARACRANDSRLAAFVDALESSPDHYAMEDYMTKTASQLARVLKNHGGRQLEVQLQDGTTIKARVSGTLGTRGRAANKAHVEYVMSSGDVILISGGIAAAKVPKGLYKRLQDRFTDIKVSVPKSFFAISDGKEEDEDEEDGGWTWDLSAATAKAEASMARSRARSDKAAAGEVVGPTASTGGGAATAAGTKDDSDDDDGPLDVDAI